MTPDGSAVRDGQAEPRGAASRPSGSAAKIASSSVPRSVTTSFHPSGENPT